jgi:hypothetical protein
MAGLRVFRFADEVSDRLRHAARGALRQVKSAGQ